VRLALRGFVLCIVAISVIGSVSGVEAQPTVAKPTQQIREGRELYGVHCSSCHGMRLEGSALAPTLFHVGAAAVDYWVGTGRMPAMVPPNVQAMHERPQFSQEQIDALVAYVTTVSPGGSAIPQVGNLDASGNLQRGRAIFAANCQACHGAMGEGGSVGYGHVAPSLYHASVTQVAEAVRIGPGQMPPFSEALLSQRDLEALVHYVNVLQTQTTNPGGFTLANMGPFAEGLVAWVFGMGALLVVVRLIGSNT